MTTTEFRERQSQSVPKCLSLTVDSQWGHFRKVDGNIVKRTYRAIPRTTIAGLLAAIMGLERDSYYDLFGPDASALAISPVTNLETMSMPMNTMSTDDDSINSLKANRKGIKMSSVDQTADRQQHNYEVLREPEYRIDVWLDDAEHYQKLKTHLEEGTMVYSPSMGLSEYLARLTYHGEYTPEPVEDDGVTTVESVVPNAGQTLVPTPDTSFTTERTPAFMEAYKGQRKTTAFVDTGVATDASTLKTTAATTQVDDRNVVFF